MELSHFKHLIDQAVDMGAKLVTLDGFGEPLLDHYLPKKISYARKRGLKTYLTTNGIVLNELKAFAILAAGLSRIRFSMFPGSINRGKNIMLFCEINRKYFENKCETNLNFVDRDQSHVYAIRRTWETVVDHLEIWRPHNWSSAMTFRKKTAMRLKTCGRPDRGPIQIAADGTVGVCCFDYNFTLNVGDSRLLRLEDIIKGEAFEKIRSAHRRGALSHLICGTCDQLNIEDDPPLLYSTRDPDRQIGKTSTMKFNLRKGIF